MSYEIGEKFAAEWNRVRSIVDGQQPHAQQGETVDPQRRDSWAILKIVSNIYTISGANAVASGRYNAEIIYGETTNNPGMITESDLGNLSTATVEVWNIIEVGIGNGLLPNDKVMGLLRGFNSVSGRPIYHTSIDKKGFWATVGVHSQTVPFASGSPNGPWAYAWTEVQFKKGTGAGGPGGVPPIPGIKPMNGHRFGTTTGGTGAGDLGPAYNRYEINFPAQCVPVPGGCVVWIEQDWDDQTPPNPLFSFFDHTIGETGTGGITLPQGYYNAPDTTSWIRGFGDTSVNFTDVFYRVDAATGTPFLSVRPFAVDNRGMVYTIYQETQYNLGIPRLAANPATAVAGTFFYNTTTNRLTYYNGTSWISL